MLVMLYFLGNVEEIRVVFFGIGIKCIGKSKLSVDGKICKLYCYYNILLFYINEYIYSVDIDFKYYNLFM